MGAIKKNKSDIIVNGGGLIGLTTACIAAQEGFNVTVIEKNDITACRTAQSDGRVSAIALGSKKYLEQHKLWNPISQKAGPIWDIRILNNHTPLYLHFDHKNISSEPLGYMVENHTIINELLTLAENNKHITIIDQDSIKKITSTQTDITITTENKKSITAQLLIAADGKFSKIRKLVGIEHTTKEYQQTAIVGNVYHEKNHQGVAIEHFLPSGPFAILPMHGGHHSSLVFTETHENAAQLLKLNEKTMTEEITSRFSDFLGPLTLTTPLYSYPLSLTIAKQLYNDRVALIGDAAHSIHPIAGQGLNLGIRDIESLLDKISEQQKLGLDFATEETLHQYQIARKYDIESMVFATDTLNALFTTAFPPLKLARKLGLSLVNKLPHLKKHLMLQAMGIK